MSDCLPAFHFFPSFTLSPSFSLYFAHFICLLFTAIKFWLLLYFACHIRLGLFIYKATAAASFSGAALLPFLLLLLLLLPLLSFDFSCCAKRKVIAYLQAPRQTIKLA